MKQKHHKHTHTHAHATASYTRSLARLFTQTCTPPDPPTVSLGDVVHGPGLFESTYLAVREITHIDVAPPSDGFVSELASSSRPVLEPRSAVCPTPQTRSLGENGSNAGACTTAGPYASTAWRTAGSA